VFFFLSRLPSHWGEPPLGIAYEFRALFFQVFLLLFSPRSYALAQLCSRYLPKGNYQEFCFFPTTVSPSSPESRGEFFQVFARLHVLPPYTAHFIRTFPPLLRDSTVLFEIPRAAAPWRYSRGSLFQRVLFSETHDPTPNSFLDVSVDYFMRPPQTPSPISFLSFRNLPFC